jgi:hypothetical protein
MRALVLLPAVAGLLAGCTVAEPGRDEVAAATAGRTAGPPENCVPIESQQPLHVLDRQTLAVDIGRTTWINRLQAPCPGLDASATLVTETWGGRYCRGDHVRSISPGMSIPGPVCVLGTFTPYRMVR